MSVRSNVQITLIEESDKCEKIKLVEPNIIQNRPDLLGYTYFQLLCLKHEPDEREVYIPFKIESDTCELNIYMMEIEKHILDAVMRFVAKKWEVFKFFFVDTRGIYPKAPHKGVSSVLELPDTYEVFLQRFSRKTRYNRRREIRALQDDYACEIKHLEARQIPLSLVHQSIKIKSDKYLNKNYILQTHWILPLFISVSDCWVMSLNGKEVAMIFYTITPNSSCAVLIAIACEPGFEKYFIGSILFYHSLKGLIDKKITHVFLGGGTNAYKRHVHSIQYKVCGGIVTLPKPLSFMLYKAVSKLFKKTVKLVKLIRKINKEP